MEAGLRSGNKYSPVPEEMNPRLTRRIAELHLAPTKKAEENLIGEGIAKEQICITGNTVIDALKWAVGQPCPPTEDTRKIEAMKERMQVERSSLPAFDGYLSSPGKFGPSYGRNFHALRRLAEDFEDVAVVFPMHKNPAVRRPAQAILGEHPRILLAEPMEYLQFAHLLDSVLPDSYGFRRFAGGGTGLGQAGAGAEG